MSDEKIVWMTADGVAAEPGVWYLSKRGHIAQVTELLENGRLKALVHSTGNIIEVWAEQIAFFKKTEEPSTPAGTWLLGGIDDNTSNPTSIKHIQQAQTNDQYSSSYSKYPHIIPGSIYKVKNVTNKKEEPFVRGKKKKIEIKGQVRCKINCEICGEERDIKVQDAFQVKLCLDCKGKKKKKDLQKFLEKKSK